MSISGQVAIVTGGARGLGRAYALRLAELGADVALLDIDLDAAARMDEALSGPSVVGEIEALGRRGVGIEVNLCDEAAARDAIAQVVSNFGSPRILVNNAGGMVVPVTNSTATTSSLGDAQTVFDLNFWSMFHCCQAVVPAMRDAGGGTIVNTSSQTAVSVYPGGAMAAYGASKAAVAQVHPLSCVGSRSLGHSGQLHRAGDHPDIADHQAGGGARRGHR